MIRGWVESSRPPCVSAIWSSFRRKWRWHWVIGVPVFTWLTCGGWLSSFLSEPGAISSMALLRLRFAYFIGAFFLIGLVLAAIGGLIGGRLRHRVGVREYLFTSGIFMGSFAVAGVVPVPVTWDAYIWRVLVITAGAMFLTTLVMSGSDYRALRMLRRRVAGSWGRVCPECGYDLSRLPEQGECPECGAPFTTESLAEVWKPWLEGQ